MRKTAYKCFFLFCFLLCFVVVFENLKMQNVLCKGIENTVCTVQKQLCLFNIPIKHGDQMYVFDFVVQDLVSNFFEVLK